MKTRSLFGLVLFLALCVGAAASERKTADAVFCFKMPKGLGGDWAVVRGTFKIEDFGGDPMRTEIEGLQLESGRIFKNARLQDLPSESTKEKGHPSTRWVRIHLGESILTKNAGMIETIHFVYSKRLLDGGSSAREFNRHVTEVTNVSPYRPWLIITSDHVQGEDGPVSIAGVESEECPVRGPRWRR